MKVLSLSGTSEEMSVLENKFVSGVYTPFEPEHGPLLEKEENVSPPTKKSKKCKLRD